MGRQKQAHTQNKPCTDVPNHASHPTNWADKFLHETIWKKKGTVSFLGQQAEGGLPRATLTAILLRFPASQNAVLTQRVSCLEHSSKNAALQFLRGYFTGSSQNMQSVQKLKFCQCMQHLPKPKSDQAEFYNVLFYVCSQQRDIRHN